MGALMLEGVCMLLLGDKPLVAISRTSVRLDTMLLKTKLLLYDVRFPDWPRSHAFAHRRPQPLGGCRLGRVRAAGHQPSARDTEQRTTEVFLLRKHPAIRNVINLWSVLTLVPNLKFIFYLLMLSLGILACRGTP